MKSYQEPPPRPLSKLHHHDYDQRVCINRGEDGQIIFYLVIEPPDCTPDDRDQNAFHPAIHHYLYYISIADLKPLDLGYTDLLLLSISVLLQMYMRLYKHVNTRPKQREGANPASRTK